MKSTLFILITFICAGYCQAQVDTLRIATYNLLNFPDATSASRVTHFRTIIDSIDPDILVVQELTHATGVTTFLNDVMNHNGNAYQAAPFLDGFDTDNGLFYKIENITLLGSQNIVTPLRAITEYVLLFKNVEFSIYSLHLKASQGETNENRRLAEATILRTKLNALFSTSAEPAYNILTVAGSQAESNGRLYDPISQFGNWHNNGFFSSIHSQSTRTTSFGDGSTGGLDDRFDIMLVSNSLLSGGGMDILPATYRAFGNDGNHFNQAISAGSNNVVSAGIANALHQASDHLPVLAEFIFGNTTSVSGSPNVPLSFDLSQNYPNPFNGETLILFSLPTRSRAKISIYDLSGRLVRELTSGNYTAGNHQILWNGRNDTGQFVGSGVYFYRLIGSDFTLTKKMILVD
jgi:endonuclease/exonuclease/phosphatase family metal-dependent hydrolase